MVIDATEEAIIVALAQCVRVLSVDQIASSPWLGGSLSPVEVDRRLRRLQSANLVRLDERLAKPEVAVTSPLIAWVPGTQDEPELGRVAYRLKQRWGGVPRPTRFVSATSYAKRQYGGFGKAYAPRADELTHDLHMGRLWTRFRGDLSDNLLWISEDRLRSEGVERLDVYGGRVPDAVLRSGNDPTLTMIIEFGGAYAKPKLREIHEAFRAYPYTLW